MQKIRLLMMARENLKELSLSNCFLGDAGFRVII